MPSIRGTYSRIRTSTTGRRVRLTISSEGRILDSTPIASKVKRTRTGKRLALRRRRIAR